MALAKRKPATPAAEATDYLLDDADVSAEDTSPDDDSDLADDDEDAVAERTSAVPSGWKAALEASKSDGKRFTNEFKFTEDAQLVKFLSSEPFAVYDQHWIERQGKRSFICLSKDPRGCPLCEKGDETRPKVAFSVLNLSAEEPVVEMLVASPTLTKQLAGLDGDPKTGPLDRLYWALTRAGSGKQVTYNCLPVKPRDLDEDWGADPTEVEETCEKFAPLTKAAIGFTPYDEMVKVAREINAR